MQSTVELKNYIPKKTIREIRDLNLSSLRDSKACGEKLVNIKAKLKEEFGHGSFLKWLKENEAELGIKKRQAQRHMKAFLYKDEKGNNKKAKEHSEGKKLFTQWKRGDIEPNKRQIQKIKYYFDYRETKLMSLSEKTSNELREINSWRENL